MLSWQLQHTGQYFYQSRRVHKGLQSQQGHMRKNTMVGNQRRSDIRPHFMFYKCVYKWTESRETLQWAEVCTTSDIICMIVQHVAQPQITFYNITQQTITTNTLNVHIKQRWDAWGRFRVLTTIRHFPHNAPLNLLFIYSQLKDSQTAAHEQYLQHTVKHVQYLQNGFIYMDSQSQMGFHLPEAASDIHNHVPLSKEHILIYSWNSEEEVLWIRESLLTKSFE